MRCTICNRRPSFLGVFVPHKPERFGGRIHLVQLCSRCHRRGRRHWMQAVEKELARRAAAARN